MSNKRFTVEEADDLVPFLQLEFSRLVVCQEQASDAAKELGGVELAMGILKGQPAPAGKDLVAQRLMAATSEILAAVERINGQGCLIKDVELGIVDFPSSHAGREVNLCWQFGEPQVLHFHGTDEADAKRQRLFESASELLRIH